MATTDYVSTSQMKAWLGITSTVADAVLPGVISAASRAVDHYCGRRFWLDDDPTARVYDVEFTDLLFIRDVGATAGVVFETSTYGDGIFDKVWTRDSYSGYGYELQPRGALSHDEPVENGPFTSLRVLAGAIPVGAGRGRLTARYGWPTVPQTIYTATLLWASRLYGRKDAILGVSGGPDVGFIELARRLDPDIARALNPYRVHDIIGVS